MLGGDEVGMIHMLREDEVGMLQMYICWMWGGGMIHTLVEIMGGR
jgi:hypothetical protein